MRALLRETRTIAVVGLSPKPDRPSHGVSKSMQSFGYRIVPVNRINQLPLSPMVNMDPKTLPDDERMVMNLIFLMNLMYR